MLLAGRRDPKYVSNGSIPALLELAPHPQAGGPAGQCLCPPGPGARLHRWGHRETVTPRNRCPERGSQSCAPGSAPTPGWGDRALRRERTRSMAAFSPVPQRDSARNLGWLKTVKESHGSVERSSLTLARAINSRGTYVIQAPAEGQQVRTHSLARPHHRHAHSLGRSTPWPTPWPRPHHGHAHTWTPDHPARPHSDHAHILTMPTPWPRPHNGHTYSLNTPTSPDHPDPRQG